MPRVWRFSAADCAPQPGEIMSFEIGIDIEKTIGEVMIMVIYQMTPR